ncbi:unnamed protein product [Ascophyllum nodosum]
MSMEPEPAMDYVRRAVWSMLYVDDVYIVSRSSQGLEKMIKVIVEVYRPFALTASAKKPRSCAYLYRVNYGQWCESRSTATLREAVNHSKPEATNTLVIPSRRCFGSR